MDIETEILYLARGGKEDIFVEKCPKQQHVVDGIRFLYRQYVKKKPGVILNDPNGHSRRTQIILFASAIRPVLERPVLILCSEGDEGKWREYFEKWTNMGHDITTDTTNPFAKKVSVYISPIHEVTKFRSREWGGVIIDSDVILKEVLKININAKFRVWITGVDLKNELTIFSQLYKWLYPKERFDPDMFKYDKSDPSDVVAKAVLLDSFMEDVVLWRNDMENIAVKSPETPKVTRKNKDATGTKIKRTKRRNRISSSEDDSPTKISKTNKTTSNDNNYTNETIENAEISNIKSRASIDDFRPTNIDDRSTLDDTSATVKATRAILDNIRATYQVQTTEEITTRATLNARTETYNDTRATLDDVTTVKLLFDGIVGSSKIRIEDINEDQTNDQRDKINEISEKPQVIRDEEDNSLDLLLKYEVDEKYTPLASKKSNGDQKIEQDKSYLDQKGQSNDSAYDKDTQENFDKMVVDTVSCHVNIKGSKSNNKNKIPFVSNEKTSNKQIILNDNKIENEIDLKPKEITKEVKESEDLFLTESMTILNKITVHNEKQNVTSNKNEIDLKSKETKQQSEDLFSTESMSTLNKISNNNEICKDGVGNNETDPSSSLDAKIKQMEELAMKKFKGSLLDSIF